MARERCRIGDLPTGLEQSSDLPVSDPGVLGVMDDRDDEGSARGSGGHQEVTSPAGFGSAAAVGAGAGSAALTGSLAWVGPAAAAFFGLYPSGLRLASFRAVGMPGFTA